MAEKRCRDAISQHASEKVFATQAFGFAEGTIGALLAFIAYKTPPGAILYLLGAIGISIKGGNDWNTAAEIMSASNDAGVEYCNCAKYLK